MELSGKDSLLVQKGIISILKDSLENIEVSGNEVGIVNSIGDGIVYVDGIDHAMYGEIVIFENGQKAMVQDVREDEVGCILFDDEEEIEEGTKVVRSGRMAGREKSVPRIIVRLSSRLPELWTGSQWIRLWKPVFFPLTPCFRSDVGKES